MATTKIECVHILNLWIGMERLFDSCARQVLKTCQVRSSVVRQHDVVGARRLIITLGRERWAQSTKDLASALDKSADWVTYIQREGGEVKILLGTDARHLGFDVSHHYPLFALRRRCSLRELSNRLVCPIRPLRKEWVIELPKILGNHESSPMVPGLRIPLPIQLRRILRHHIGSTWRRCRSAVRNGGPR